MLLHLYDLFLSGSFSLIQSVGCERKGVVRKLIMHHMQTI